MVDLFRHSRFFTPSLFEKSPGLMRSFALQFLSQFGVTFTEAVEVVSGISLTHRIGGDISNTQVNAKKLLNVLWLWCFFFAGGKEVESTVNQNQIALTALMSKQGKLLWASHKGNSQAAQGCPDAHCLPINVPTQDSIIIGNRAVRLESALGFPVKFVSIGHFGNTAHYHLSGQAKLLFDILINQLVNFELVKNILSPGHFANVVASGIGRFQCFKQGLMFLWRSLKFYFGREFHRDIVTKIAYFVKCLIVEVLKMAKAAKEGKPFSSPGKMPGVSERLVFL
jgi:hypothetical protein